MFIIISNCELCCSDLLKKTIADVVTIQRLQAVAIFNFIHYFVHSHQELALKFRVRRNFGIQITFLFYFPTFSVQIIVKKIRFFSFGLHENCDEINLK